MSFTDYTVQYKKLFSNSIYFFPPLLPESNLGTISKIREDGKRPSTGQMVVNNQGKVVSLNQQLISIWKLPEYIVTSRCERQVFRFIAEQLENSQSFLSNIRNCQEQMEEVKNRVELRDGRCFSQKMKPQWYEKKVIGRIYQFRPLF